MNAQCLHVGYPMSAFTPVHFWNAELASQKGQVSAGSHCHLQGRKHRARPGMLPLAVLLECFRLGLLAQPCSTEFVQTVDRISGCPGTAKQTTNYLWPSGLTSLMLQEAKHSKRHWPQSRQNNKNANSGTHVAKFVARRT